MSPHSSPERPDPGDGRNRAYFSGCDKPQNHTNEGKGKEKKKERGGRKEEKRKTAIVALLVFVMGTLEIWPKK